MRKRPLGFACLAALLLIWLLTGIRGAPYEDYSALRGKEARLTGRVYKKEAVSRDTGPVQVIYLRLSKDHEGERVICYLSEGQELPEMGTTITVNGKISDFERATNPGQFDACSYYQLFHISYRLNQTRIQSKTKKYDHFSESLYQLRCFLSAELEKSLPKEEAAIMQTMLLGEKGGMEKELKALYQRNGIAHILAISGLHISMIGMGLYRVLCRCGIPRKPAAVAAVLMLLPYGIMTGLALSAVRAILMFALRMIAVVLDRSYDLLTALAVAALLLILQQPLYLSYSGFWFSFGCVAGIGTLLPALTSEKKKSNGIAKALLSGLSMTVITLPVYLWFYYQFPPYSFWLNLLIIPLMSFLMAAGILLLLAELVCSPLAFLPALLIRGILQIYEGLCRGCEGLPINLLTLGRPKMWQLAVYFGVLFLVFLMQKKLRRWQRWGLVGMAAVCLLWQVKDGLELTFLDVGQGDCIYIKNAGEGSYLVDGGSSSVKEVGQYRILPFLKYQGAAELEAVFVTHPDEDHCNGILELLEKGTMEGIKVKNLVLPDIGMDSRDPAYRELEEAAREAGVPVSYLSRGQQLSAGKMTLTCLHPKKGYETEDANAYSLVLALTYGHFSALLTGDVEGEGEKQMMEYLEEKPNLASEEVTVLKVAHHGSKNSTPKALLHQLCPELAIISCGRSNRYGHPHEELKNRLEEADIPYYITPNTGAVTISIGRKGACVKTFCNS